MPLPRWSTTTTRGEPATLRVGPRHVAIAIGEAPPRRMSHDAFLTEEARLLHELHLESEALDVLAAVRATKRATAAADQAIDSLRGDPTLHRLHERPATVTAGDARELLSHGVRFVREPSRVLVIASDQVLFAVDLVLACALTLEGRLYGLEGTRLVVVDRRGVHADASVDWLADSPVVSARSVHRHASSVFVRFAWEDDDGPAGALRYALGGGFLGRWLDRDAPRVRTSPLRARLADVVVPDRGVSRRLFVDPAPPPRARIVEVATDDSTTKDEAEEPAEAVREETPVLLPMRPKRARGERACTSCGLLVAPSALVFDEERGALCGACHELKPVEQIDGYR